MVAHPHPPGGVLQLRAVPRPRAHATLATLPAAPTPLVGRDAEVAAVRARLLAADVRLLTLTGPPGVGKTRLALQVAADLQDAFADGVWFVDLAPITDPALVLSTIAQALGIYEPVQQSLIESLTNFLRSHVVLLVLDNFEQVVDAAVLVRDLVAATAGLTVLVTSRRVLQVRGEYSYAVPPLTLPDPQQPPTRAHLPAYAAVQLFVDRAQAAGADFALTDENAAAVAAICQRVDGLPLALELAAARIRLLSPQPMLARLDRRLQLLTGGPRDLPVRQQTLRDTIAWSYDLLTPAEQRLFRRLAVFVGGWTLAAAEAVCNVDGDLGIDVLDGMGSLVDQSLVRQELGPDGEPRFGMLETIREFAANELAAAGEGVAVGQRHGAAMLGTLRAAHRALAQGHPHAAAATAVGLSAELANARAALQWAIEHDDSACATRLIWLLLFFWEARGLLEEGQRWCEAALAMPRLRAPGAPRARLLWVASLIVDHRGDRAQGRRWAEECIACARLAGDRAALAHGLQALGWSLRSSGEDAALAYAQESLALFRELADPTGLVLAHTAVGMVATYRGDAELARASYEAASTVLSDCDAAWLRTALATYRAQLAVAEGDYAQAARLAEDGLRDLAATGDGVHTITLLHVRAGMLVLGGHAAEARPLLVRALELGRRCGMPEQMVYLIEIASGLGARIHPVRSARLFGAAGALREAYSLQRPPWYAALYGAEEARQRAALGEAAFAAAWAVGRALTLDEAIAEALHAVEAGEADVKAVPNRARIGDGTPAPPNKLTAREAEVLRLIAAGHSNPAIAQDLVLSIHTVERHTVNIYAKIGARGRADAVAFAHRHGLTQE
jgi:non-specific serine/threonine protein kinase